MKDTCRLKGQKKIFRANGEGKKAGVAILIDNEIDFKIKAIMRQRMTLHND